MMNCEFCDGHLSGCVEEYCHACGNENVCYRCLEDEWCPECNIAHQDEEDMAQGEDDEWQQVVLQALAIIGAAVVALLIVSVCLIGG